MGRKEIVFSASDVNLDDTTKNYTADIRVNQSGLLPPILGGNNQVVNLGPDLLPLKLAGKYDPTDFGANYYLIRVTGAGPNNRSTARIETMRARIFKKEDESKLLTGGEG